MAAAAAAAAAAADEGEDEEQQRQRQQHLASLLMDQLNERRKEIIPLLSDRASGKKTLQSFGATGNVLGSGYTKLVLKVVLPTEDHQAVALKFVNEQGNDMEKCLQDFGDPRGCHELVCLGLVRLLHFLSRSPLGSVGLLDFQPRQFVMVSGELKLTDLDDASVEEPACRTDADCVLEFPHRNFTLRCHQAKGRYFFTYLLPHQAPPGLTHLVDRIMNSTDYTVMRGVATAGDLEYRCWPSYSQQGCVLAVHSALEAASLCSAHSQSGFSHLVPDGRSEVYLRKAKSPETTVI
ncbi:hypothetical protein CRUP_033186 [Coryphaenoides rupestris]|nr:hypothetical protein CRUP_033186 [Coryphaenoides rupestris]